MKSIKSLIGDVHEFLSNIKDGDKYVNSDPELEDGLQFELYMHLKYEKEYDVVYELSLPKLKPYLEKELNEAVGFSGFPKDSLRPDLVVDLENEGLVCFELKYNETDEDKIEKDLAKCRVYVKHCADVHFAEFINLSKYGTEGLLSDQCEDDDYGYSFFAAWDKMIDNKNHCIKAMFPRPIKSLWEERLTEIENGEGKFAKYEFLV